MEINKYNYRRGGYLTPLDLSKIDSIAIHHTENDNSIDVNTDYHMDVNKWSWLGYNYYIAHGVIYEVRGYKYKAAGVKHENHHVMSIAVQGNYDIKIPSQKDMDALQYLCDYLKAKVPSIKNIKGHNHWNQTSCPGKLFPIKTLKLNNNDYVTKQQLDSELKKIKQDIRKLKEVLIVESDIRVR